MSASLLFQPLRLRELQLRNRIVISPMGTYAAQDGLFTDWHMAHQAKFAQGGAALVFTEATAVAPEGRITYGCGGLWSDTHVAPLRRIVDMLHALGAHAGIQIGHGGRKASTQRPWHGNGPLDASDLARGEAPWEIVSATEEPWGPGWLKPKALQPADLDRVREQFRGAAARADIAGYDVLEIHGAHGYLLHSFLSPLSNTRTDLYGGDLAGRMRFPLEIAAAVRAAWPAGKPLFWRASAVDGVGVGWSLDDSIALARELKTLGIDVVDCSSGGMRMPRGMSLAARAPGFQVPFAHAIRQQAHIATMAVGLIRQPRQAEAILQQGQADLVAIGREALHDPFWPVHAAQALGADPDWTLWPQPYGWWLKRRDAADRAPAPGASAASPAET